MHADSRLDLIHAVGPFRFFEYDEMWQPTIVFASFNGGPMIPVFCKDADEDTQMWACEFENDCEFSAVFDKTGNMTKVVMNVEPAPINGYSQVAR